MGWGGGGSFPELGAHRQAEYLGQDLPQGVLGYRMAVVPSLRNEMVAKNRRSSSDL